MAFPKRKTRPALEERFLAAYDAYARNILRHISFRVEDADTAKDITADVFMKAWQYLRAGNEVKDLKNFFYKIANNAVIDHYRSRRSGDVPLDDLPEAAEPQSPPDFEERLDAQTLFRKLQVHMDALPPGHKELLIYRYIDELDVGEIRTLTGKSAPNIYTTLHRALKILREKLRP